MATTLNPYLSFSGNAAEAMQFYKSVFGGELSVSKFGDFGAPEGVDPEQLMHARLDAEAGFTLMGADSHGPDSVAGDAITVSLSGDDGAALHGYWDALTSGGTVQMPLEKQVWGDEFGMCIDKYGVPWMVNIAGETSG